MLREKLFFLFLLVCVVGSILFVGWLAFGDHTVSGALP